MANPFHYRPVQPVDPNDGETDEWEDNWLSNSMAWFSRTFLPSWCDTPEHWTSKFSGYLHTSCPCCLTFRALTLGLIGGCVVGMLLSVIFYRLVL